MSRTTPPRLRVGIADYAVTATPGVLSTSGLGSCLGIVLFDTASGVAGLLHAMLPEATAAYTSPAKFVDTGVEAMLVDMQDGGATVGSVRAKIAGGSTMLNLTTTDGSIGDRNIDSTRMVLASYEIPIVAEDVGGEYGRSIQFDTDSSDLKIKTAYQGERVI